MWTDRVEELKKELEDYDEVLNEGCSIEHLELFQKEVKVLFNHELPKEYIDFLSDINGIEYNGFIVYGVDDSITNTESNQGVVGYIDSNKIWYENEWQKKYLFFGDSHISWYCFDIEKNIYVELDKPSGSLSSKFNSFNELLNKIISDSLL